MDGEAVAELLARHRYRFTDEYGLQALVESVLFAEFGTAMTREAVLTPPGPEPAGERIDFLVGRVGVEVKIAGQASNVARQLRRYAASPDVDHLVLVTARLRLTVHTLGDVGVPLYVVAVADGVL